VVLFAPEGAVSTVTGMTTVSPSHRRDLVRLITESSESLQARPVPIESVTNALAGTSWTSERLIDALTAFDYRCNPEQLRHRRLPGELGIVGSLGSIGTARGTATPGDLEGWHDVLTVIAAGSNDEALLANAFVAMFGMNDFIYGVHTVLSDTVGDKLDHLTGRLQLIVVWAIEPYAQWREANIRAWETLITGGGDVAAAVRVVTDAIRAFVAMCNASMQRAHEVLTDAVGAVIRERIADSKRRLPKHASVGKVLAAGWVMDQVMSQVLVDARDLHERQLGALTQAAPFPPGLWRAVSVGHVEQEVRSGLGDGGLEALATALEAAHNDR
jgi:hypothetical protein